MSWEGEGGGGWEGSRAGGGKKEGFGGRDRRSRTFCEKGRIEDPVPFMNNET